MQQPARNPANIPEHLISQLNRVHDWLLRIHKALLDQEKIRYERTHAPIRDSSAFLNLLLNDPFFAWLRAASGLIVQIDEYVESKKPVDAADGELLVAQAKVLLSPSESGIEFQKEYARTIQESPEIARLHAEWKAALQDLENA